MRFKLYKLLILCTLFIFSCRDDFTFEPSVGGLTFSKNTVYLDTVFTNIGSSTYRLKVYNKEDKNIKIPKIQLGKGQSSKFRISVDGVPGKEFDNVELLAKDSMYVFIEVTADVASANPSDMLYTDEIRFGNGANFQKVDLVTLVKDAVFIYPERNNGVVEEVVLGLDSNNQPIKVKGSNLSANDPVNGNELIWTKNKPYVVYGYAKVPDNATLIVEKGARVHFHADSGLVVGNGASLKVNGEYSTTMNRENEVIFQGDRLEPDFSDISGQWGTVLFLQGSKANNLNHLTIKNATVGILVLGNDGTTTPTIDFNNVQIYNCSNVGILARNGNLIGRNVVLNNCGEASLGLTFGGRYDFTHCTFANFWNKPNQTVMALTDEQVNSTYYPLVAANFKNCIFYGGTNFSINLDKVGNTFNYKFTNCLIKFIDNSNQFGNNSLYAFGNSSIYQQCKIATSNSSNNPNFMDVSENDFRIKSGSSCINSGDVMFSNFNDLNNIPRGSASDIGAYEFIP